MVSNIGEAYDGPVDLARLADFEPFIPLPLRNRGTNSLGQQGTCDCGACASSYDAAGSCLPISAPPAPPAPTLEEMRRLSVSNPFAPPAPPYVHKQTWDQRCECNCPGEGTCKFTPAFGDLDAINQGTCVGYGDETKCECTPPYLQMTGAIYNMDQPMSFSFGAKTNFSFVTIAVRNCSFLSDPTFFWYVSLFMTS